MRLYAIDCDNQITQSGVRWLAEQGFDTLITYPHYAAPFWCAEAGMHWMPIAPVWTDHPVSPEQAFRNAEGRLSTTGGQNYWPSFWAPPDPWIAEHCQAVVAMAGTHWHGAVVSTSIGECHMPTQWDGVETKNALREMFWCHDDYALDQWAGWHGGVPPAHPDQDKDDKGLDFCRDAMYLRLASIMQNFPEGSELVPMLFPFGYTRASWALATGAGGHSVFPAKRFIFPCVMTGPEERITWVDNLASEYEVITGVEAGWPTWEKNFRKNLHHLREHGYYGALVATKYITHADNRQVAARIIRREMEGA